MMKSSDSVNTRVLRLDEARGSSAEYWFGVVERNLTKVATLSMQFLFDAKFIQNQLKQQLSLPVRQLEPIQIKPEAHTVFQGVMNNQEVVVRFTGGRNSFPVELWIYSQLAKIDIPCPTVLGYGSTFEGINQPVIVMTKLPGCKLKEAQADDQLNYYQQFGELVKRIHSITTDGFGWLEILESHCRGQFDSWPTYWEAQEYSDILKYLEDNSLIAAHEREDLVRSYHFIQNLDLRQGKLLHGDLNAENVLVQNGQISGIIDPAHALSGDPRLDIANARMWQVDEQRHAFNKGYGAGAEDAFINAYLCWTASSKLAWRHQNNRENGVVRARQVLDKALEDIL